MKYNCIICKMQGVDRKAVTLTRYNGYEISVCQEHTDAIHPEYMVLKNVIRATLDSLLADELYEDNYKAVKLE